MNLRQTVPEHRYFDVTEKKIIGDNCKRLTSYSRITRVDSAYKAQRVIDWLKGVAQHTTFEMRDTVAKEPFDMLIVDEKHLFLFFHKTDLGGRIASGARISEPRIVAEYTRMFMSMWRNSAHIASESDDERRLSIAHYTNKKEEFERKSNLEEALQNITGRMQVHMGLNRCSTCCQQARHAQRQTTPTPHPTTPR